MISGGELAFAEPQLTQSVFTLAASCYRVLGRLEDQSGHGDWGPDDAGRGLARLTWAQRAGLLGAYRVPPRRRPEDAHPLWHGPFEGTAAFAERIVGRAELAALPPEFKDQLRVELGSKKLKSHVAGKRAAEDSSAWLKRHRAAIDADEEAALDEATERLEALEAWPRKSDEGHVAARADPSEAAAAPLAAGAENFRVISSVRTPMGSRRPSPRSSARRSPSSDSLVCSRDRCRNKSLFVSLRVAHYVRELPSETQLLQRQKGRLSRTSAHIGTHRMIYWPSTFNTSARREGMRDGCG